MAKKKMPSVKKIYVDYNSTTPVHPEVVEAMMPYYRNVFGNASSIHRFGQEAHRALDLARESIAKLLNCDTSEIVFTSGGTESDNHAIKGIVSAASASSAMASAGNHIITSKIEHSAVLSPCKYLENTAGAVVTYLPVDEYGVVGLQKLDEALTDKTILVSIMSGNNEVGTLQPVEEIGRIIAKHNESRIAKGQRPVYFHTDAVQCAGKISLDLKKLNIDLLSLSSHKIYGPKGVGALFIRKGTKIHPLIHGGHHEKSRRAGTENIPGIAGFGKACDLAVKNMATETKKIAGLRDAIWQGISKKIECVRRNGHPEKCLSNTLNVSFEFIEGESLLLNLDLKGIAASTGSACTSGSLEPSHVLSAIGVDPVTSQSSIRFSLGMLNTQQDVDYILDVLPGIVTKLREMSPLYKKKKRAG